MRTHGPCLNQYSWILKLKIRQTYPQKLLLPLADLGKDNCLVLHRDLVPIPQEGFEHLEPFAAPPSPPPAKKTQRCKGTKPRSDTNRLGIRKNMSLAMCILKHLFILCDQTFFLMTNESPRVGSCACIAIRRCHAHDCFIES